MAKFRLKSLLQKDSGNLEFNPNLVCRSWQELEQYATNCHACELYKSRTQVVSGRYSQRTADLLIIGSGPGKEEDEVSLTLTGISEPGMGTVTIAVDSVETDEIDGLDNITIVLPKKAATFIASYGVDILPPLNPPCVGL